MLPSRAVVSIASLSTPSPSHRLHRPSLFSRHRRHRQRRRPLTALLRLPRRPLRLSRRLRRHRLRRRCLLGRALRRCPHLQSERRSLLALQASPSPSPSSYSSMPSAALDTAHANAAPRAAVLEAADVVAGGRSSSEQRNTPTMTMTTRVSLCVTRLRTHLQCNQSGACPTARCGLQHQCHRQHAAAA